MSPAGARNIFAEQKKILDGLTRQGVKIKEIGTAVFDQSDPKDTAFKSGDRIPNPIKPGRLCGHLGAFYKGDDPEALSALEAARRASQMGYVHGHKNHLDHTSNTSPLVSLSYATFKEEGGQPITLVQVDREVSEDERKRLFESLQEHFGPDTEIKLVFPEP